jgi:hypothetical protein
LVALIAVFALVMPTYAAELKFGGYYDTKYYHTSNIRDGNDDADDQMDGVKTRMRLYFTAIGSENLKAVVKTEFDSVWGCPTPRLMSRRVSSRPRWARA